MLGDSLSERKKEYVEFCEINSMRRQLGMPLLEKGWVNCIGSCDKKFFTFDKKGNRMCEECKEKPNLSSYEDFVDSYNIVGA